MHIEKPEGIELEKRGMFLNLKPEISELYNFS